jgi:hypothetical protein
VQNCTQNSLRKNILSQILEKFATFDNTPKKSLLSKSGDKILWVNNNKIWWKFQESEKELFFF